MSNSAISGPIFTDVRRSPSGSAAAPSWSFADATGTGVYLASTDVLALSTAGLQRVVVDAAGNVGIGTASPTSKLTVVDSVCTIESADTNGYVRISGASSNAQLGLFRSGTSAGGGYIGANDSASFMVLNTSFTERMRIDSDGRLLVGTATSAGNFKAQISSSGEGLWVQGFGSVITAKNTQAAGSGICYLGSRTTDGYLAYWLRNGALIGSIYANTGSTTYNTGPSDHRLKEEVKPFVSGLQKVLEMKPVSFKWKESQKEDYGFIAHELQEVIPEAVTGQKDAVNEEGKPDYQAIFPAPAQMIASLVSAIQELKTELDEAKAKIAALEAK